MSETKDNYDTSEIALNVYRVMYRTVIFKDKAENPFEIITPNGKRPYIKNGYFKFNGKFIGPINFSGESDFNFGDNAPRNYQHIKYNNWVTQGVTQAKTPGEARMYCNYQDISEKLFRSIANVSLMPQNGNLQAAKKGIGDDRLDTFVWALNEFYNNRSNLLLNHSAPPYINNLESYLGVFGNVYNYCDAVYHINEEELVDDLIKSGKEPIDTFDRWICYISLASRFWKQKIDYLKRQIEILNKYLIDAPEKVPEELSKKVLDKISQKISKNEKLLEKLPAL